MKNKFLKLFQAFIFIVGGLMITYVSVGAITKVMVPRGGTGAGEFQDGAFLIGSGINPISTSSDIVVVGGKIGVGTLSPSVKFSVGTALGENAYFFYNNDYVGDSNNSQSLRIYRRALEGDSYIGLYNNADRISQISGSVGLNFSSPDKISFGSSTPLGAFTFQEALNSAQDTFVVADHTGKAMFLIDSSGKVGIGASSPSNILQIKGANAGIDVYNNSSSKNFDIEFTGASEFLIGGPDVDVVFLGNNESADYIEIKDSENFIALGDLEYNETGSYLSVNSTDKVVFLNDIELGIGIATPARPLHMVGDGTSASGWARFGLSATEYTEIGHRGSNSAINAVGDGNLDFRHDNNTKMTIEPGGNVGIGTTSPMAKFTVVDGAILSSGTIGDTPMSGVGTRLMWIPAKKAFRSGGAVGTEWDNANIGNYSFASGNDVEASGVAAFASGKKVEATHSGAFAQGFGQSNIISSSYGTFAQGYAAAGDLTSSSYGSFAQGLTYGFPITASGYAAFAQGMGQYGAVEATELNSLAIGDDVSATAMHARAMGLQVDTAGQYSFVVGRQMHLTSTADRSVVFGYSSTPVSITQPDAFIIYSGNVGIGTTSPSQKLSVSGNVLADSYIEYSKKYSGNALKKIINIKCEKGSKEGDWCSVAHDTLPQGVRYEKDDFVGRDLGANVQLNTKAIQELYEIMVKQTERIEKLESILAELGIFCK